MTKKLTDRQFDIIQAAGNILTNQGISGLTIKNLAKEMKFSESAIYRHFSSKEKIIIALLEYLAFNMDERYIGALTDDLTTEEKFKTIFENHFTFFKKNPHFVVAVFADGLLEESEKINEKILKIMAVKIKHLTPIVEEGQKNNLFTSAISANEIIHIVMGSVRLQMYKWRVANFQFDITKSGGQLIRSLLELIKSKK